MKRQGKRRVGLLGGSFDPPHRGHLWMARRARSAAALDAVWLLPAYRPPHKSDASLSSYEQRLAMTRLLAAEEDWLEVCEPERERGGISYSLDTVLALKAEHGEGVEFYFIIGEDSLRDMDSWHEPDRLCRELRVLVLVREGFRAESLRPCWVIHGEEHPAQSRIIRASIGAGRAGPWLSPTMAAYIAAEGLYRGGVDEGDPQ